MDAIKFALGLKFPFRITVLNSIYIEHRYYISD